MKTNQDWRVKVRKCPQRARIESISGDSRFDLNRLIYEHKQKLAKDGEIEIRSAPRGIRIESPSGDPRFENNC